MRFNGKTVPTPDFAILYDLNHHRYICMAVSGQECFTLFTHEEKKNMQRCENTKRVPKQFEDFLYKGI